MHRPSTPGVGALVLWASFWLAPLQVAAQTPGPPASAAAAALAASAATTEAAAAMERAQRMAANPLRIILEAGKLKRGPAASDGVAAVAAPAARLTPTTAMVGNSAPARSAPAPAAPVSSTAVMPSVMPSLVPSVATPVAAPEARSVVADSPLAAAPAAAIPAAPTPAAPAPDVVPQPDTAPSPAPTPAEPAAPRLEQPRLLVMVEPQLPRSVADGMNGSTEVAIDLTIRADGSVASVTLLPPVSRALQRYIVAALENWRFAPLPAQRVHRVNLVINGVP